MFDAVREQCPLDNVFRIAEKAGDFLLDKLVQSKQFSIVARLQTTSQQNNIIITIIIIIIIIMSKFYSMSQIVLRCATVYL